MSIAMRPLAVACHWPLPFQRLLMPFAPLPVIAGRRMKPKKSPFSFAISRGRREGGKGFLRRGKGAGKCQWTLQGRNERNSAAAAAAIGFIVVASLPLCRLNKAPLARQRCTTAATCYTEFGYS